MSSVADIAVRFGFLPQKNATIDVESGERSGQLSIKPNLIPNICFFIFLRTSKFFLFFSYLLFSIVHLSPNSL